MSRKSAKTSSQKKATPRAPVEEEENFDELREVAVIQVGLCDILDKTNLLNEPLGPLTEKSIEACRATARDVVRVLDDLVAKAE